MRKCFTPNFKFLNQIIFDIGRLKIRHKIAAWTPLIEQKWPSWLYFLFDFKDVNIIGKLFSAAFQWYSYLKCMYINKKVIFCRDFVTLTSHASVKVTRSIRGVQAAILCLIFNLYISKSIWFRNLKFGVRHFLIQTYKHAKFQQNRRWSAKKYQKGCELTWNVPAGK